MSTTEQKTESKPPKPNPAVPTAPQTFMVPIKDLIVGKNLSRSIITDEDIEGLAGQLKRDGQMVPVIVRRDEKGRMVLTSGNRRRLAAIKLGWPEIWATLRQEDEKLAALTNGIENLVRENLTDFDTAHYYLQLKKSYGFEGKEIAAALKGARGTSVSHVNAMAQAAEVLHKDIQEAWKQERSKPAEEQKITLGLLFKWAGLKDKETGEPDVKAQLKSFKDLFGPEDDEDADPEEPNADPDDDDDDQPKKMKRPSQVVLSNVLDAIEMARTQELDISDEFLLGVELAVKFALGTKKGIRGLWSAKKGSLVKPPKAEAGADA